MHTRAERRGRSPSCFCTWFGNGRVVAASVPFDVVEEAHLKLSRDFAPGAQVGETNKQDPDSRQELRCNYFGQGTGAVCFIRHSCFPVRIRRHDEVAFEICVPQAKNSAVLEQAATLTMGTILSWLNIEISEQVSKERSLWKRLAKSNSAL